MNRTTGAPLRASIIVNNYNYGQFVGEAIESALAQTYPHTEVIVVDDGSTDDSRAVLTRFEDRVVTVLKPNGGQASALNLSVPMARGDVVYLLDSDDVLEPHAVERSIGLFEDPSVVKAHWPMRLIDRHGNFSGVTRPNRLETGNLRERAVKIGPANHQSPPASGNAWARSLLAELFPVHEQDFRNDVDSYLMAMAPLFGAVAAVPEPLSRYRVHGTNITSQLGARWRLRQWEMRAPYLRDRLLNEGVTVSIDEWRERNSFVQRLRAVLATIAEIDSLIPAGESLILVANELYTGGDFPSGRPVFQLAPGEWDREDVGEVALQLLERGANAGATFLAVASTSSRADGRLDDFYDSVRSVLDIVLENERCLLCRMATAQSAVAPVTGGPDA